MQLAQKGLDVQLGIVADPRSFNTVLCAPDLSRLEDRWQLIVLADGALPGEADAVRSRCPNAQLMQMKPNPAMRSLLGELLPDRETLGRLYLTVCRDGIRLPDPLVRATGMTLPQIRVCLRALDQAGLIRYQPVPWSIQVLPRPTARLTEAQSPVNSPVVRWLRAACEQPG